MTFILKIIAGVRLAAVSFVWIKWSIRLLVILLLTGCSSYRPGKVDNLCHIFWGETDWYEAARDAQEKWGTPIQVMMAIMHQESRFVDDAEPEREWFLFIPLPRSSTAYGFAQAQNPAWQDYIRATDNSGADRDDFDDAIDFIGWYTHGSAKRLKISKWDAYSQYLAYHEGRGGFEKKSYQSKTWLINVAQKVKARASLYGQQLKGCKARLDDKVDSWF